MCGTDCTGADCPAFCVAPDDPLEDDSEVRGVYWYHSSTNEDWPSRNFDPAARLTELTKRRMERMGIGAGAVERWAERQRAKALHVGTYAAAIENMFRRMRDQDGALDQFYLHRVRLTANCVIEPGVHVEPTDFVGDAYLAEVCAPKSKVLRYVNVHEDPSGVSLALEAVALEAVQSIPTPLPVDAADAWVLQATERLMDAASTLSPQPKAKAQRWSLPAVSALSAEARALESEVAARLPMLIQERFCVAFDETSLDEAPASYPMRMVGLARLVTDAQAVLALLDAQPWRVVR